MIENPVTGGGQTQEIPKTNGIGQQQTQLDSGTVLRVTSPPPQPAPRTRLSSQNSNSMTNGTNESGATPPLANQNGAPSSSSETNKSDEEAQVFNYFHFVKLFLF